MTREEIYKLSNTIDEAAREFEGYIDSLEADGRVPMRPIVMQRDDLATIRLAGELLRMFAERRTRDTFSTQ